MCAAVVSLLSEWSSPHSLERGTGTWSRVVLDERQRLNIITEKGYIAVYSGDLLREGDYCTQKKQRKVKKCYLVRRKKQ